MALPGALSPKLSGTCRFSLSLSLLNCHLLREVLLDCSVSRGPQQSPSVASSRFIFFLVLFPLETMCLCVYYLSPLLNHQQLHDSKALGVSYFLV